MIGIHDTPGSFSGRWITYCESRGVPYRRINCLATDVVSQCTGLDGLLWHWSHNDPASQLVERQIISSFEQKGMVVFPNIATCAHFDDKVAQKYILEAIDAPFIPTWVFYNRHTAMKWIEKATWPKVFKLSSGAGSINVRLVRSREEATALCRQAFGRGFPTVAGYLTDIHTRVHKTQTAYEFLEKLFRAPQTLLNVIALRYRMPRQRGYLYFQEFIPGNTFDTRITIIGNRAFGFQRMNRPNDFRASGSGTLSFDPDKIDKRCVEIAFKVADRLGTQSLAFDFLFDLQKKPLIVEISYCYVASAVHQCPGHWDRQGTWHQGQVWPEEAIMEDVLSKIRQGKPIT